MTALSTTLPSAQPWRGPLLALALVLLAIGWMFRDTIEVMVGVWWRSDTFAHCMLVLPISLWLIWRKRAELARLSPHPQPWLVPLMVLPVLAWLLSEIVVVNAAGQFAFVTLVILTVPAVLGIQVARTILFPLLFLYFAVPFGEFMLPTMMEWTADFTVSALRMSGVPVYREGQHFSIPSGNWSVIDECSGVRYVMASFLVGTLFAYLNYNSYRKRVVFMGVALVLPVFANWLRAYMIVMMAHLSGNRLAVGVDHILYGWVFFGLIVAAMFAIGSRWSEPEPEVSGPPADAGSPGPSSAMLAATAAAIALVAAAPQLALSAMAAAERAAAPVALTLPDRLSGAWAASADTVVPYQSQVVNPSAQASRVYASREGSVGLHVAYFRGQTKERKLVNSQHLLTGMRDDAWSLPTYATRDLVLGDQTLKLRSATLLGKAQGPGRAQVTVWRLYWIDGAFYTGDARAKIAGAVARLKGHGDEGALITLHVDRPESAQAERLLETFVQDNRQALGELLARVQQQR